MSSSSAFRRSGNILALITPDYADNISLAADFASLLAVRDFNARSTPYPGVSIPSDCDFELTITHRSTRNQTYGSLAGVFQRDVLLAPLHERPMAILGGVHSADSIILALLGSVSGPANSSEVMMNMSPVSNSADLESRESDFPYFSRTIPSIMADAEVLCRFLNSIGVNQLAVLYLIGNYGLSFYFGLLSIAPYYNIQVYEFSFNYETAFNQAISDLKASPLRYVFCVVDVGYWAQVLEGLLLEPGVLYSKEYVWMFSDSFALELEGDVTSYLYPYGEWLNRSLVLSLQSPPGSVAVQRRQFIEAGHDPEFLDLWNRSHAGERFPDQTPNPSLFALLTYDATIALGLASCMSSADNVTSVDILQSIHSGLNFTGTTGHVSFDVTNSRIPEHMPYVIQNIFYDKSVGFDMIPSMSVRLVDQGFTTLRPIVFKSGSTAPPPDLAPVVVTTDDIPVGVQVFCLLLTALSLLFAIACGIWTVLKRNLPAVRASQPIFLGILSVGTFFLAFSSVFLTWQQPLPDPVLNVACMANPWFMSVGLTTIFAALFAKTWRIRRLYSSAKVFRRVTIRARDVVWPLLILLTINVIILTVWTVLDPLEWDKVIMATDSYGRVLDVRYSCYAFASTDVSLVCLLLMVAVNIFSSVLLNVESYRARKLPSEFNETNYIAITNLVLLEACTLSVPILVVVRDLRTAFVLVRSILNFILCMGVLLPIFVPKFTSVKSGKAKRHVPQGTSNRKPAQNGGAAKPSAG
jgi:7 transmembrane sweet-taste receptor of 3 GCPR/Receptor family ligand binding region